MKQPSNVVRVEIERADGTIERAIGNDAESIWAHFETLLLLAQCRSGNPYDGPQMKVVKEGRS